MSLAALPYLNVARFTGPDAGSFLQSQLSADIDALRPGDATFAAYCSPRGQVIALLLVCREADDYLVAGSADLLPPVLERLQIFVFRSRVEFALQAQTHVNGVPASSGSTSESAAYQPGPVELRYLFSDQPGDGSSDEWKLEELRRQVVWLGAQSSEKFIPQMLGYDQIGAVSFSKGCYPGQEIVARAHYLGKVKRKPQLVMAEGLDEAATGEKVELCRDGQWSGAVVVDQSPGRSGGTLIFTVAPDHEAPVEMLRYQGHDYRCATI